MELFWIYSLGPENILQFRWLVHLVSTLTIWNCNFLLCSFKLSMLRQGEQVKALGSADVHKITWYLFLQACACVNSLLCYVIRASRMFIICSWVPAVCKCQGIFIGSRHTTASSQNYCYLILTFPWLWQELYHKLLLHLCNCWAWTILYRYIPHTLK